MIKILTALLAYFFISPYLYAKSINSFDEALNLAFDSLLKSELVNLPPECMSFLGKESDKFYYIEVSELSDEQCRKHINASPVLIHYEVNKITGEVKEF